MTTATNHEVLLQGANNAADFNRALQAAKNESTAEEYSAAGALEVLEFGDKSRLLVNIEARTAEEAA